MLIFPFFASFVFAYDHIFNIREIEIDRSVPLVKKGGEEEKRERPFSSDLGEKDSDGITNDDEIKKKFKFQKKRLKWNCGFEVHRVSPYMFFSWPWKQLFIPLPAVFAWRNKLSILLALEPRQWLEIILTPHLLSSISKKKEEKCFIGGVKRGGGYFDGAVGQKEEGRT